MIGVAGILKQDARRTKCLAKPAGARCCNGAPPGAQCHSSLIPGKTVAHDPSYRTQAVIVSDGLG